MEPRARTHSTADVRFLKAAVAMRLISAPDAKRCLAMAAKGSVDAATAAEQAGLISAADCARVARRVTKRAAKRSKPEGGSKPQGSSPQRRSVPVPLLAGAAFGVAALVGLAIAFAFSTDDADDDVAVVSEVEPPVTPAAVVSPRSANAAAKAAAAKAAAAKAAAAKAAAEDPFTARTLRVVKKLHADGKTRAALEILRDMPKRDAEARALLQELEAALARSVEAKAKAKGRAEARSTEPEDDAEDDDEDEVDWPEDADGVDWPEDAEAISSAPQPRDTARSKPASSAADDDVDTGFGEDDEDAAASGFDGGDDDLGIDTNSPVAMAVGELLCVPHTLLKNAELTVSYALREGSELEDFESVGFDKFEVGTAYRSAGAYSEPVLGLEIGAGSQRLGRMWHAVQLQDQFEVEMRLWVNAGDSRSRLVFLFGKKLGVSWGQQIVKVDRRGATKPLSGVVDRGAFRGERFVRVKMSLRDGVLTVFFDGRKTAERKLAPKDLKGRFGLIAKGVRFQITELRINGVVDTSAL